MEPYRPFVVQYVFGNPLLFNPDSGLLTKEMRTELLSMLTCDTKMGSVKRPLSIAVTYTTASLARYYKGDTDVLVMPEFVI
jgi:CRISPR-associated protein Cas1